MAHKAGRAGGVYTGAEVVEDCEDNWTSDAGSTSADADDTAGFFKVGSYSVKIIIPVGTGAAALCAHTAPLDGNLSDRDIIYLWVHDSEGFAAGAMALLLDGDAACISPEKTILFPVVAADTWTRIVLDLGDASALTAVGAVGIEQVTDEAAHNLWVDDIQAISIVDGIKSWTLDYTVDALDTTDFQDGQTTEGARSFIPGLSGWSGSFEGYKDGVPKALSFSAAVKLVLAESETAGQSWIGDAFITGIHPSVSVDGVISYTYDFTGTGELEESVA